MPRSPFAPTHRFRIQPSPHSRLYVEVMIFKTYRSLHRYDGLSRGADYRAITCFADSSRTRLKNLLCEVRLCQQALHPSLIAHEMAHAALGYLTRLRKTDLSDLPQGEMPYDHPEEVFCRALQRLVGETLIKCEVAGLEPREPESA